MSGTRLDLFYGANLDDVARVLRYRAASRSGRGRNCQFGSVKVSPSKEPMLRRATEGSSICGLQYLIVPSST